MPVIETGEADRPPVVNSGIVSDGSARLADQASDRQGGDDTREGKREFVSSYGGQVAEMAFTRLRQGSEVRGTSGSLGASLFSRTALFPPR